MTTPRVKWQDPAVEYQRGLADGRAGVGRAHGGGAYQTGYDDGLDLYDQEHAEEEGWDCV